MSTEPHSSTSVQIQAPVTNSVVVGVNSGTITNIVQVAQVVTSLHQLRAALDDFVGRSAERTLLRQVFEHGPAQSQIAAICGMGGVGKTELALQLAHDVQYLFPDAQLFVPLRGATPQSRRPVGDALRDAIRAFQPQATLSNDIEVLAATLRGLLGGKRCLIVLDDAPDDETVRPFFPPAGCGLLVTSRILLSLGGQGTVVTLDTLSRAEAHALLVGDAPQLAGDPLVDTLLDQCADLPLAVRVVGSALSHNPLLTSEQYLRRLRDTSRRPAALRFEHTDVLAVLGAVYDTLASESPELARRWCMLAVCPAPFDSAAAASIWEEPDPDALVDALGMLLRYSLLAYDRTTQRFRLHDLLADVAAQHRAAGDDQLAHRRHAEHFLSIVLEAQRLYEGGTASLRNGLHLFDASWEHIQAAVVWLATKATPETDQTLLRFAHAPSDLVLQRTLPEQQRYWSEAVLQAARRQNDHVAEGRALVGLGNSYAAHGDTQRAAELVAQGLAIATQAADQLGCALASNDLAATLLAEGRADEAMPHLETALKLYKILEDRRRQGQTLLNLGSAQEALGQQTAATRSYATSLAILRETGDVRTQVFVLGNLGISYTEQGELDRARRILLHAHQLAQALGDTATYRQVGWHLGVVEARQGRIELARALMLAYVAYLRMIGDDDAATFEHEVEKLTHPSERGTGVGQ